MTDEGDGSPGRRPPKPHTALRTLAADISSCMISDQPGFRRRLSRIHELAHSGRPVGGLIGRLSEDIKRSRARCDARRSGLPRPAYPEGLPVVEKRSEIARIIAAHQVVVVCGETGSGKTTQLPKICMELGRGVAGLIGHTQPRRIAARAVAARISQELSSPLGQAVGFKVRFTDSLSDGTYLKVMTDGILLAETQGDPNLEQYDTIIIDEAHERSLNIDFLLGYIRRLLPRRRDLKLIITSATIDPERFSEHFWNAPIVQVSGRMYPVEIRCRPLESEDPEEEDIRQIDGILAAVDEACREGPGDLLIFLSGEREIRETAEALRRRSPSGTEILPLYARLSFQEQNRVFQPHRGRRIILATNVAETSLTVPGIRFVIDPGYARISRYNPRTKVQRLPIEEISQASARQRAGRCGRVSAGVCIRLYSEENAAKRAVFTQPEILRTNLASVILQMKALRLGDLSHFPFLDAPDPRMVKDGYQTLHELQAIDEKDELTQLGRELARLPIDPRLGRMILAAREEDCLAEVLVIAAALSVQDPRERPLDETGAADRAHEPFRDQTSDFMGLLKLWEFYGEQSKKLSSSKLRKLCQTNFLSFIRMREWQDIHHQLKELAGDIRDAEPGRGAESERERAAGPREASRYASIHRALLTGLLSHVGTRTEAHEYTGIHGTKFYIFPGSGLFQSQPLWVVAAELVETTRLYARTAARVQPEWIERCSEHLVTRSYSDAHWHQPSARVLAHERVSLFELPLVEKRSVHYGPIDPKGSRDMFIQHALVEGQYDSDAPFVRHNQKLVEEIERLEAKSRQRDVLVDLKARFDFYDALIPAGIYSGAAFEAWRRQAERKSPKVLFMSPRDLMLHDAAGVTRDLYPDVLPAGGREYLLTYRLEPGHAEDGITVTIPLSDLHTARSECFEWLVPGFLNEKIFALIRSLPKGIRTAFVPAQEHADEAFRDLKPGDESLVVELARYLSRRRRVSVSPGSFRPDHLPDHLRMNFRVVDEDGKTVASGRDIDELRGRLGLRTIDPRDVLASSEWNRDGITAWDVERLPEKVDVQAHGLRLAGYPAFVDRGSSVSLRLFESEEEAREASAGGLRRLYLIRMESQLRSLFAGIQNARQMCGDYAPLGGPSELRDELAGAVIDRLLLADANVRERAEFERRMEGCRGRLQDAVQSLAEDAGRVLSAYADLRHQLARPLPQAFAQALADIRDQLAHLVFKGFFMQTPPQWLRHYPRYLNAIALRHTKLTAAGLLPDTQRMSTIRPLWEAWKERREKHREAGVRDPQLDLYRWLLEEMRVSLFAQELKTSLPVSLKRLEAQWMKVRA